MLHAALRAPRDKVIINDGKNVVPDVWEVLDKIKDFSEKLRSGEWVSEQMFNVQTLGQTGLLLLPMAGSNGNIAAQLGATGKPLKDVVAIGIGGSFLGPLFVHTALRTGEGFHL